MISIVKRTTIAAVILIALGIAPRPAEAHNTSGGCVLLNSRSASWGCANASYNGSTGLWSGSAQDTKTDGYCVSLWTINRFGDKVEKIARSCGGVVTGRANGGGSEDSLGVRLFRDDGRYRTIVAPPT
jgi:hypothetical protein